MIQIIKMTKTSRYNLKSFLEGEREGVRRDEDVAKLV